MEAQPTDPYGYLLVHFLEDPDGYAERIYMDLSDGDNPHRWIPLNGGEPLLTSTIGTTGVRDPHITRNPETGVWTIVATDLRVFGGAEGLNGREMSSWHHWSRHGSTDLMVWQSDDLIHWTGPHTLDVARRPDGSRLELGMAWACESLWVPDYYPEGRDGGRGAFVIYWSSTVFPDDDRDHTTADVRPQVLWGVTRDFTQDTYEYGGVFIDTGGDSIDTTMIQRPLPDGGQRTYRITKDNAFGNGIWMDSTDAPALVGAGDAVDDRADPHRRGVRGRRRPGRRRGAGRVRFAQCRRMVPVRRRDPGDRIPAAGHGRSGRRLATVAGGGLLPLAAHQAWRRDRPDPRRL